MQLVRSRISRTRMVDVGSSSPRVPCLGSLGKRIKFALANSLMHYLPSTLRVKFCKISKIHGPAPSSPTRRNYDITPRMLNFSFSSSFLANVWLSEHLLGLFELDCGWSVGLSLGGGFGGIHRGRGPCGFHSSSFLSFPFLFSSSSFFGCHLVTF